MMMPAPDFPNAEARPGWLRKLPILLMLAGAVLGAVLLRDHLTFEALARHREALLATRDAHYGLTVLGFIAIYIGIVALSLPGGTLATLTGGFLFGLFPGVVFNVIGASTGAVLVFLAARSGFGAGVSGTGGEAERAGVFRAGVATGSGPEVLVDLDLPGMKKLGRLDGVWRGEMQPRFI